MEIPKTPRRVSPERLERVKKMREKGTFPLAGGGLIETPPPMDPEYEQMVRERGLRPLPGAPGFVTPIIDEPEAVDHPSHYNSLGAECSGCGKPIECIDVTGKMSFSIGSAVKYLWRKDHKGKRVEDLRKAIWYLQWELAQIEDKDDDTE